MPERTYRIGELATLAGVTRRTVHYYINKGLIPPAEGAGVNSYYKTDHLNRIRLIRELQKSYLPLEEIRKIIKPLEPAGVVERLGQYEHMVTPQKVEPPVQKTIPVKSYQSAAPRCLYERVDLGANTELHYPVELREQNPALLHSLVETARKLLLSLK
jgi:DNA-binding transcriptional MerR regulator